MNKIKILTITASGLAKKEGISTVILDYYSYFDTDRYQLDIVAAGDFSNLLVKEFQSIGVNLCYLPSRKSEFQKYIVEFIKLLKRNKYNAIYIHGSSAIMSIELMLAKIYGIETRVVHSHNTTCNHKIIDKVLRPLLYSSYTIALACGSDAGKWLYGKRKFDVLKNGRNVDVYKYNERMRNEMRKKLGIAEDMLVIGHVGRFNIQKNQRYLLFVLKEIIKYRRNVRMYLIGDGEGKEGILKDAMQEGLSSYIQCTGAIPNVPDMLQAMDVMLLPSLYEGLPLVVVEWQIAGLPSIVSDRVTKECAYTDLVHFMPLDDNYSAWAKKILELSKTNRVEDDERIIRLTDENGYNIAKNAKKLQRCFDK